MRLAHEDSLVRLYHGDSTKGLAELLADEGPIAIVTDPPYGIDHKSGQAGALRGKGIKGDGDLALREWAVDLAVAHDAPALVFGSWKRDRPPGTRLVLIWDKGEGVGMGDLSIPWKTNWEEIYVLGEGFKGHRGSGVLKHTMVSWVSKGRMHPNQKPVSLMEDLLHKVPEHFLIVDPFAGSAATLVAAKRMGRPAIGCEEDEQWIPGACQELAQESLESMAAAAGTVQEPLL